MKKIVFSGIQPSGNLTIGNLIGAIRNWVSSQDEYSNLFCVVDLHAITIPQDPVEFRRQTLKVVATLLACGIDPKKSLLYVQSHVPAHAQLAWVLNCVTPLGLLQRMTQYKDKASRQESVSVGLLDYPVLQAADILLFDTDLVPVGEDQRQHIEATREIGRRFNRRYGETFKLPGPLIPKVGAKIMGFDDPTAKMSKSTTSPSHAVSILEEPDRTRKILRSAVTDPGREISFSDDPERAGVNNLLTIYQVLGGETRESVEAHFEGKGYRDLKDDTAERIIETLTPIRERYERLSSDEGYLEGILRESADEANSRAEAMLAKVHEAVGFLGR